MITVDLTSYSIVWLILQKTELVAKQVADLMKAAHHVL